MCSYFSFQVTFYLNGSFNAHMHSVFLNFEKYNDCTFFRVILVGNITKDIYLIMPEELHSFFKYSGFFWVNISMLIFSNLSFMESFVTVMT